MSRVFSIFVDWPKPIDELVPRLAPLLSASFQELTGRDPRAFEARTPDCVVTISHHNFENDRDLKFEDFTYELQFRPIRDRNYDLHEVKTLSYAKASFDRMKSALPCHLMLVDDLQHKLDEYRASAITPGPKTSPAL